MVVIAVVAAGCGKSSDESPELPVTLEGVTKLASESETVDIRPGGTLKLSLTTPAIALTELLVRTNESEGEVEIEVALLSGVPQELSPLLAEGTYQYISIGHGDLADGAIQSATIRFNVRKEWIDSNGFRREEVRSGSGNLNRGISGIAA